MVSHYFLAIFIRFSGCIHPFLHKAGVLTPWVLASMLVLVACILQPLLKINKKSTIP